MFLIFVKTGCKIINYNIAVGMIRDKRQEKKNMNISLTVLLYGIDGNECVTVTNMECSMPRRSNIKKFSQDYNNLLTHIDVDDQVKRSTPWYFKYMLTQHRDGKKTQLWEMVFFTQSRHEVQWGEPSRCPHGVLSLNKHLLNVATPSPVQKVFGKFAFIFP